MKVKKVSKPALHADTYSVACVVNNNAEVLEGALNRIKELEKSMTKEEIEEFAPSEDMTREEIIALVRVAFAKWENWESDGKDDWSGKHNARDAAIKALEQEPFKNAYIQVAKERDIAIGQLNELGYSLGEKIKSCRCVGNSDNKKCRGCPYNDGEVHAECVVCNNDKSEDEKKEEHILAKIEIEKQEKWLMQAGYNALNVSIAFDSIKRALRK